LPRLLAAASTLSSAVVNLGFFKISKRAQGGREVVGPHEEAGPPPRRFLQRFPQPPPSPHGLARRSSRPTLCSTLHVCEAVHDAPPRPRPPYAPRRMAHRLNRALCLFPSINPRHEDPSHPRSSTRLISTGSFHGTLASGTVPLTLSGISIVSSFSTVMGGVLHVEHEPVKGEVREDHFGVGIVIQTLKVAPLPAFMSNLARATPPLGPE